MVRRGGHGGRHGRLQRQSIGSRSDISTGTRDGGSPENINFVPVGERQKDEPSHRQYEPMTVLLKTGSQMRTPRQDFGDSLERTTSGLRARRDEPYKEHGLIYNLRLVNRKLRREPLVTAYSLQASKKANKARKVQQLHEDEEEEDDETRGDRSALLETLVRDIGTSKKKREYDRDLNGYGIIKANLAAAEHRVRGVKAGHSFLDLVKRPHFLPDSVAGTPVPDAPEHNRGGTSNDPPPPIHIGGTTSVESVPSVAVLPPIRINNEVPTASSNNSLAPIQEGVEANTGGAPSASNGDGSGNSTANGGGAQPRRMPDIPTLELQAAVQAQIGSARAKFRTAHDQPDPFRQHRKALTARARMQGNKSLNVVQRLVFLNKNTELDPEYQVNTLRHDFTSIQQHLKDNLVENLARKDYERPDTYRRKFEALSFVPENSEVIDLFREKMEYMRLKAEQRKLEDIIEAYNKSQWFHHFLKTVQRGGREISEPEQYIINQIKKILESGRVLDTRMLFGIILEMPAQYHQNEEVQHVLTFLREEMNIPTSEYRNFLEQHHLFVPLHVKPKTNKEIAKKVLTRRKSILAGGMGLGTKWQALLKSQDGGEGGEKGEGKEEEKEEEKVPDEKGRINLARQDSGIKLFVSVKDKLGNAKDKLASSQFVPGSPLAQSVTSEQAKPDDGGDDA
eukprot:TRINITY_DN7982_c0_g1_i1.p1 TRINITY_DN7982_c0_g1~~TRINITY_DN7982_c0_g1_i1.p1  ORF type:complete len:679 (-),score=154.66 TRINITY_DN7982_c0_g1_i1:31-2067(-)